jgi:hypothetical protein
VVDCAAETPATPTIIKAPSAKVRTDDISILHNCLSAERGNAPAFMVDGCFRATLRAGGTQDCLVIPSGERSAQADAGAS